MRARHDVVVASASADICARCMYIYDKDKAYNYNVKNINLTCREQLQSIFDSCFLQREVGAGQVPVAGP